MSNIKDGFNILWLRASILGGIWASSEILIGSFLHNLRIPFSGMLLSAISVFLLTAFDKQWQQNGIIWRAGLITALMKSISPSAVIFGPMIGIFCEALLFQIVVIIMKRNIVSYSLAGAVAVSWSFVQMIVGLIIIYGNNIVLLYSNIYKSVLSMLSIKGGDPSILIFVLLSIHFIFGITAAILGYFVKKNAANGFYDFTKGESYGTENNKTGLFKNHSFVFLFFIIVVMIYGISLVSKMSFWISVLYIFCFIGIGITRYGFLLRRVINIKFWLEMTFIAMLSGFFLSKIQGQQFFSFSGLNAGYLMIFRAVLLSVSFNIVSIELTNPRLNIILKNKKMKNVSSALETSFKTLPILIALMTTNKNKIKQPLILVSEFINSADRWIEYKLQNN